MQRTCRKGILADCCTASYFVGVAIEEQNTTANVQRSVKQFVAAPHLLELPLRYDYFYALKPHKILSVRAIGIPDIYTKN